MSFGVQKIPDPASGADVFVDDTAGGKVQGFKLLDGTEGSTVPVGTRANPIYFSSDGLQPYRQIAADSVDTGSTTTVVQIRTDSGLSNHSEIGDFVYFPLTFEFRRVIARSVSSITLDSVLGAAPSIADDVQVYRAAFIAVSDSNVLVQLNGALPPGTATIGRVTQGDGTGYGDAWKTDLRGIGGAALSLGPKSADNSIPVFQSDNFTVRIDEGATYTYIGHADAGALTSDSIWRIKRLTNADGTLLYPYGSASFLYVWDDKASLPYS